MFQNCTVDHVPAIPASGESKAGEKGGRNEFTRQYLL